MTDDARVKQSQQKSERRNGRDRRVRDVGRPQGPERRTGRERRKFFKIPIFIKFISLATLLIVVVITTISIFILEKQRQDYFDQLVVLGDSMVRIAAENAADKLLTEEDLVLFQLVKDLAADAQVTDALIADSKNVIKAHNDINKVNTIFSRPKMVRKLQARDDVQVGIFAENGDDFLLFEKIITYQEIPVGSVALVISPSKIYQNIRNAKQFIFILTGVIILIGAILSLGLGFYFSIPIRRLKDGTQAIRSGDFEHQVQINRNDELGDLGRAFNQMSQGLKERDQMRQSLELAMEVQHSLLPQRVPQINGLDIAGRSIYCDETGGDYYDFLKIGDNGQIGFVVGDITGHGIPSALLMATARAFIRQRSRDGGSIARIVTDINRVFHHDVHESNTFMTLFYATLNLEQSSINWVRAGHDPAIFYDPETDAFDFMKGPGVPLGVVEDWQYEENTKKGLKAGQIIVISTDGVWDTLNWEGKAFGKQPVMDIIQKYQRAAAQDILGNILAELNRFRENVELPDDVTLMVIKIQEPS